MAKSVTIGILYHLHNIYRHAAQLVWGYWGNYIK